MEGKMKPILSLVCVGSMMLALSVSSVFAQNADAKAKRGGKSGHAVTHVSGTAKGGAAAMRSSGQRVRHSVAASRGYATRSVAKSRDRATMPAYRAARSERAGMNHATARAATRTTAAQRQRYGRTGVTQRGTAMATARERNYTGGAAWRAARNRNVRVVNTWRSSEFSGGAYAPFRDYRRVYHDRGWYRSHYGSSIVFVLGGWWYWNAGYWYPAWGYAPYTYYPYDGPIYTGYASLTPDRVSIQVQRQLQQDGYYAGPIDGSIGPMTRRALAAFQADNGLAVTSAIDQPTLSTMGIS
jgi:Putative peptidoglycan binding domain